MICPYILKFGRTFYLWYVFVIHFQVESSAAMFVYCSYSAFYLQSDFLFYFSSFIFQTCSLQLCILVENSASVFNFSLRCYVNVIYFPVYVFFINEPCRVTETHANYKFGDIQYITLS